MVLLVVCWPRRFSSVSAISSSHLAGQHYRAPFGFKLAALTTGFKDVHQIFPGRPYPQIIAAASHLFGHVWTNLHRVADTEDLVV